MSASPIDGLLPRVCLTLVTWLTSLIGLAAESTPKIRNVLFIVSDDLRASAIGTYGHPHSLTPHMDALAARGTRFDRAYCQGTVCRPSRQSFMFSRYHDNRGISLGEHLIRNHFYSARVGKIFHMRVPGDIIPGTNGNDVEACWTERFNSPGREAHTPGNYALLNKNIFTSDETNRQSTGDPHRPFVYVRYEGDGSDQPDYKTASKTIELLQAHKDKSFFIAAGFVRPHYPSVAPEPYFQKYPFENMKVPVTPKGDLDDMPKAAISGSNSEANGLANFPDNQKRMWMAYLATVTFMDEQLGRILAELDRLNLRDSTAVIFTSDHGYHLGDHTFWQKANLHEEVIRVPLIISAPGYKAAASGSVVELVDLYPTVCDLLGVEIPASVQGKSLQPLLADPEAEVKSYARSFVGKGFSWRSKHWAYMQYKGGQEELYDMKADPNQYTNLANRADQKARLKRFRDLGHPRNPSD